MAETAKAEAANVASEAKTNAKDLLHQAKSDLTSQAGTQQQKAAEGIRTISSQLRTMADAPDQQGVASDLIRQAADRSESVASWLDNRDPGSLLDEVKSFARQRPGTFLLLAAGAGCSPAAWAAACRPEPPTTDRRNGHGVPPRPVQPPVTEGTCRGRRTGDDRFSTSRHRSGTHLQRNPSYGEPPHRRAHRQPGYGHGARPLPGQFRRAGVPLRDVDDPYAEGGGRHL